MTSEKQQKLIKKGLSSAYPRGRALLPFGTVVQSCREGKKRLYEFQRIRVHNMFNLTKKPSKGRVTKPASMNLPCCCDNVFRSRSCSGKNKVSGSSERLHPGRDTFRRFTGTAGAAGHLEKIAEQKGQLFRNT